MKFKTNATGKEWLVFIIFSIFLFFVVAVLMANLIAFQDGSSLDEGFVWNLGRALTGGGLALTILVFLLVLGFIFYSVKSHFFDNVGGGLFSKGGDKGYSRLLKEPEMKRELKSVKIKESSYKYGGFPIIYDGKSIWLDDGESHNLVMGSTGTGKTQCIIHPLVKILARTGESMIIMDPKSEIYRESAGLLKEKGYKIVVLNFREPQRGNMWNPLALPYQFYRKGNIDKAMELLDDVAFNILYEEGDQKDAFWEKTSADFFSGLAIGLFEDAKPEEININSISVMATVGEERYGIGRSNYIKEYYGAKDPAGSAYTSVSGTVFAPEDTKGSVLATFRQKIRLFAARENLSEMLSASDFDMANIGKEKTAVFVIIQDEKRTLHPLATIFIKQCYEVLIDVAQESPKGELPIRTNFILDEFANMPPFKDVTTMITAARSRHIRFTMIIQNFAQLNSIYGEHDAQTIRSNCSNLVYLLTTELSALKEISELCGEIKVKVGKGDKEREESRPLVTVSDLQKMKQWEAMVLRTRLNPFKTKLTPNFKIDWGLRRTEADPFVTREKTEVHTFDLKTFVMEMNKNKPNVGIDSPFGGMSGNPFMNNPFMNSTPPAPNAPKEDLDKDYDDVVKRIEKKLEAAGLKPPSSDEEQKEETTTEVKPIEILKDDDKLIDEFFE